MEIYCVICKKILETKILKKIDKIDKWFYQNELFVERKSQGFY